MWTSLFKKGPVASQRGNAGEARRQTRLSYWLAANSGLFPAACMQSHAAAGGRLGCVAGRSWTTASDSAGGEMR